MSSKQVEQGRSGGAVESAAALVEALGCSRLPVVEFATGTWQGVMIDLSDLGVESGVFATFPAEPDHVRCLIATAVLSRYR